MASIVVSSPLDTIKTRIQCADFGTDTKGTHVLRELLKHEGVMALWKGLTPKILIVGPKLGQKHEHALRRAFAVGSILTHSFLLLATPCRPCSVQHDRR